MAAIKTSPTKNQVSALSLTLSMDIVRLRDMLRDMAFSRFAYTHALIFRPCTNDSR